MTSHVSNPPTSGPVSPANAEPYGQFTFGRNTVSPLKFIKSGDDPVTPHQNATTRVVRFNDSPVTIRLGAGRIWHVVKETE